MKLGVNIDHVATLREARYRALDHGEPDPVACALLCEEAGAHGITAHLREDRRHIRDHDVFRLRKSIQTRLNLELSAVPEIVQIALRVQPDIVCLVPERRLEVTTEGGLNAAGQEQALRETCRVLQDAGIPVSLFIDPDARQIEASASIGAPYVELHTGKFAEAFRADHQAANELSQLQQAAQLAHDAGLKVNAGHGLNYDNLPLLYSVPHLIELNIGHSIISRAMSVGIGQAVREMLKLIAGYPSA